MLVLSVRRSGLDISIVGSVTAGTKCTTRAWCGSRPAGRYVAETSARLAGAPGASYSMLRGASAGT